MFFKSTIYFDIQGLDLHVALSMDSYSGLMKFSFSPLFLVPETKSGHFWKAVCVLTNYFEEIFNIWPVTSIQKSSFDSSLLIHVATNSKFYYSFHGFPYMELRLIDL